MISRYETEAMRHIWGEAAQMERWTRVEVAASEAWAARGQIPAGEMQAIRDKAKAPSADRVRELEKVTNHDVVAFVRALGEIVGEPARRHLHRGLTSSDVVDTALAMAVSESLEVLIDAVKELGLAIARRAREHKLTPCVGRTHGVHAEPTTFGLRLAGWYAEVQRHLERLRVARMEAAHGKMSGAVGNFSQSDPELERGILESLDLWAEPVATQVVPRDRHAFIFSIVAILGSGLERFAVDIRAMQRTEVREAEEPFAVGQTGSSAMPHKRNPITSERIAGMARLLRGYMVAGAEDVALWHERDISHSSVERMEMPDATTTFAFMLERTTKLIDGLVVYPEGLKRNLDRARGLWASEGVLLSLVGKGIGRQDAYVMVQRNAMAAFRGEGEFATLLKADAEIAKYLNAADIDAQLDLNHALAHVDAIIERALSEGSR
jgi:adenylosuccinate lyase